LLLFSWGIDPSRIGRTHLEICQKNVAVLNGVASQAVEAAQLLWHGFSGCGKDHCLETLPPSANGASHTSPRHRPEVRIPNRPTRAEGPIKRLQHSLKPFFKGRARRIHFPTEGRSEATDSIAVFLPLFFFCHFLPKNRMSSPKTI
jgi:hypothetical protein